MKGTNLGELEELVLLIVASLGNNSYGLKIKDELISQCNRAISLGTIHATLHRLEKKGFLQSSYDKSSEPNRSGRPKLIFRISEAGKQAVTEAKDIRNRLWENISREVASKYFSIG